MFPTRFYPNLRKLGLEFLKRQIHRSSTVLTPDRSFIHVLSSLIDPIDSGLLFDSRRPLEVDLGCGDGSFLVDLARQHPELNFLGVERLLGRIRKADRKANRAGVENVRLIRIEAGYFLSYLLPSNCVRTLHICFPDPWPKRRHWNKRLVDSSFPSLVKRVLEPAGRVYLRTDNHAYHEQMQSAFSRCDGFCSSSTPDSLRSFQTDFERAFNAQGIPTLYLAYERMPTS